MKWRLKIAAKCSGPAGDEVAVRPAPWSDFVLVPV
jgi:hypothetical protein